MGTKSRAEYNAYMREYMLKRYHRRHAEAISFLGGKCVECAATDRLELDHIDRAAKAFDLSSVHSASQGRWDAEVAKCQVLCNGCHIKKTSRELAEERQVHGSVRRYGFGKCRCRVCVAAQEMRRPQREARMPRTCGMYSSYKSGCRCSRCRAANATYMRAYNKRRREYEVVA